MNRADRRQGLDAGSRLAAIINGPDPAIVTIDELVDAITGPNVRATAEDYRMAAKMLPIVQATGIDATIAAVDKAGMTIAPDVLGHS